MSRFIKLTTLDRRSALPIRLLSKTRVLIGTMKHDGKDARHHCELPEETFLKYAQDIARLGMIPGAGVYVSGIRDESVVPEEKLVGGALVNIPINASLSSPLNEVANLAGARTAMSIEVHQLASIHHNTLRRMAAEEGIDISGKKGAKEIADAIVQGRKEKSLATA